MTFTPMRLYRSMGGIALMLLTACGGGGSSSTGVGNTASGVSFAAAPLLPSSYENAAKAGDSMGSQPLPNEVQGGNAVAFGDFFGDGQYALVTHSLVYNPANPATATNIGSIHFWGSLGESVGSY